MFSSLYRCRRTGRQREYGCMRVGFGTRIAAPAACVYTYRAVCLRALIPSTCYLPRILQTPLFDVLPLYLHSRSYCHHRKTTLSDVGHNNALFGVYATLCTLHFAAGMDAFFGRHVVISRRQSASAAVCSIFHPPHLFPLTRHGYVAIRCSCRHMGRFFEQRCCWQRHG